MMLAFQLTDVVTVPFGWLLGQLYQLVNNYGVAMIIFALFVQAIMIPINAKSKQNMMKMSRVQPLIQDIQKRYAGDSQKQNEMLQKLYQEEGISMGGGCLWSMVPLFILIPLFTVIREPLTYILGETAEVSAQIIEVIKTADPSLFTSNTFYDQMVAAPQIPNFLEELKAAGFALSEGVNFDFFGIDLGIIPDWKIWTWTKFDWAHIGGFLIPVLSAGSQVLSMFISTKMNNSLVTNEKGIEDKETAKNSQANQTSKVMMWTMPLMSLWIGFTLPTALSLYWLIQGLVSIVVDTYLTRKYRKIYDAEDAERLQRALAAEAVEAEKERVRAERRAANPDGITENTSKKKLQKKLQQEEAAAKAAAAKEYAAKKGIVEEEEEKTVMSGIPSRPYCKGRNYDPNRYNTEE